MTTNYSATELYQAWLDVMCKREKWKKGSLKLKDGTDAPAMRRGCWGQLDKTCALSWACANDSGWAFDFRKPKEVRLCAVLFDSICDLTGNGIRDAKSLEQAKECMNALDVAYKESLDHPSQKPDFWHFSSLPEDVHHDVLAHLDAQAREREENSKVIRPWDATLYSKAAGLQKAMAADGMDVDGADGTYHRNKWSKGLYNGKPGALNGHFWLADGILPEGAVVMPKIHGENRPYELSWSYEFTEELPCPFAEEKRGQDKPFSAKNGKVIFDLHGVVVLLPLLAYLYILRMFPGVKFMAVADCKRSYENPVAAVVDGEVKAIIMPMKELRYQYRNDAVERYRYSAHAGKFIDEDEPIPSDAPAEEGKSSPAQQYKIGERYEIEFTLEGRTTAAPATIAMVANGGGYLVFDTPALSFPLDASYVKVIRRLDPGEEVEFRQVHVATVPSNPMRAYPFQLRGESTFRDYYSGKPIDNQQYEGLVSVGRDSILMATWMDDGERAWGSIGASCPFQPDASYTAAQHAPKEDAYPFQFPGDATFYDSETGEPLADQQYEGLALVGRELAPMVTWLDGKERAWELPASPSLGMAGPSCAYLPTFCYTEPSRSPSPAVPSFAEFVQHCKEMDRQCKADMVTRYTEELRRLESGEPPATPMEATYWRNRADRIAELHGMIAEAQTAREDRTDYAYFYQFHYGVAPDGPVPVPVPVPVSVPVPEPVPVPDSQAAEGVVPDGQMLGGVAPDAPKQEATMPDGPAPETPEPDTQAADSPTLNPPSRQPPTPQARYTGRARSPGRPCTMLLRKLGLLAKRQDRPPGTASPAACPSPMAHGAGARERPP